MMTVGAVRPPVGTFRPMPVRLGKAGPEKSPEKPPEKKPQKPYTLRSFLKDIQFFGVVMASMFSAVWGINTLCLPSLRERAKNVQPQQDNDYPWPQNTRVYTAGLQEHLALIEQLTPRLMNPLLAGQHASLSEAFDSLKDGWAMSLLPQVPMASTGGSPGWHVKDNGKVERYVLIVVGPGTNLPGIKQLQERAFNQEAQLVKQVAVQTFAVPDNENHIKILNQPSYDTLEESIFNWLGWVKNKPNAEVLVYFIGHGYSQEPADKTHMEQQGRYHGRFAMTPGLSLSESRTKDFLNTFLMRQFKHVSLVVDTCHSGAWVAQAQPLLPKAGKATS